MNRRDIDIGTARIAGYPAGKCAAIAQQPVAVDVAAAKRAVSAVMSAPDGISVEAFFRIVLEAALAESVPQRYDIDADPNGIREDVTGCVRAALYCGANNVNPPPEGHWLRDFWLIGRAEASRQDDLAALAKATGEQP